MDGGIVTVSSGADDHDYPAELVSLIADVESRHFWFGARNDLLLATLQRVTGSLQGKTLLDVGCGTGWVLAALERAGIDGCGIDMNREALLHARARVRGPLMWSTAEDLPFSSVFDFVSLCDVIEHADHDVALLRAARGVLRRGGFVVVTVPAGADLWTAYDTASGHKRRYEREQLIAALAAAGLRLRHISSFNCLPLIAQRVQRWLTTWRHDTSVMASPLARSHAVEIVRKALRPPPRPLNSLLHLLTRWEAPFRGVMRGGSMVAIAQRID